MVHFGALICAFFLLLPRVIAETDEISENINSIDYLDSEIHSFIEEFEQKAAIAVKARVQENELEQHYTDMANTVHAIVEAMDVPNSAYKFIEAKGIGKVIAPYIDVSNVELRTELLILAKKLFNSAPTTTSAMTPITMVDKVVDIFEDDDDLATKTRVLDILYAWLPDNPIIQTRLMKVAGLEPFYDQAHKLDAKSIYLLLDLFNKVLDEHIRAHSKNVVDHTDDVAKINMYRRIGLVEKLSMPGVCTALLNILETAWNFRLISDEINVPVFMLLMKVEKYCSSVFEGKEKEIEVFENFLEGVEGLKLKDNYYKERGVNITEFELGLADFIKKLKIPKDEL